MTWAKRTLVDVKTEIELPVKIYWESYGTPEYWAKLERELNAEIRDFEDFIRDHRSRDSYGINIVKVYNITCEFCGHVYDLDNDDIIPDCCEEAMQAAGVKIEYL